MNTKLFSWGISFLILTLVLSLSAYYLYNHVIRVFALGAMILSLMLLLLSMVRDLDRELKTTWLSWVLVVLLVIIYFYDRMEFHRFDFMLGDASDYFAAGMCSVLDSQDIGYILPLSATITAIGYDIFGLEYALLSHVIFYATSIPLFYFLFRKLNLTPFVSFLMSLFLIFVPLSLWYAKSTFSETSWQVLLFVYVFLAYKILQEKDIKVYNIILLYALLFLAPMLRVEAVFYYALLLFLALYHFWKFRYLSSSLIVGLGIFVVAFSTHITLGLRHHYMVVRQFSRVIPNATEEGIATLLYALAGILFVFILFVYFLRKYYKKVNLPAVITLSIIPVKILTAYIFAVKKDMFFLDLFIISEYNFLLGNFGLPIALLVIAGMIILYINAYKGDELSLVLIVVYVVFCIPFVMQSVTFDYTHAFLFYWNRYYFSVLMMIHMFSFALVLKLIYKYIAKFIESRLHLRLIIFFLFAVIVFSSMNIPLYRITANEGHLQNSHKFYTWVKDKVADNDISFITEKDDVYIQNGRGSEKFGYMLGRMFSLYGIHINIGKKVDKEKLYDGYEYKISQEDGKFILCVSKLECNLVNEKLYELDKLILPLEWREHFEVPMHPSHKEKYKGDLSKSNLRKINLHATIYTMKEEFAFDKSINFSKNPDQDSVLFPKGWEKMVKGKGVLSSGSRSRLVVLDIDKDKYLNYSLSLNLFVLDASKKDIKNLKFKINSKIAKEINVDSPTLNEYSFIISEQYISNKEIAIEIESDSIIILQSLKIFKSK